MFSLLIKSLLFYRRQYFWTFAGLVLAAAILNGALSVGSSVRQSLHDMAAQRLGNIELMLDARLNPVQQRLADELSKDLEVAPVLMMLGSANYNKSSVSNVFINGIDSRFSSFFSEAPVEIAADTAYLSPNLAAKLAINNDDEFVLRVRNHSLLPGDLPLTGSGDEHIAIRLKVQVLASENNAARFSLMAGQIPPMNVFVNLKRLQEDTNMSGLVNEVLLKNTNEAEVKELLSSVWQPEDSNMLLRKADSDSVHELISSRVFLPEGIVHSVTAAKVLTYMANEISHKDKMTPYSIVSGISFDIKAGGIYQHVPDLAAGEVLLNSWTAEDLSAKIGDKISVKYYVDNEDGKLREDSADFTVKAIVEPELLDRLLMPAYPGIAEEEHCRDWEPGIPMDMTKIRNKDEKYWETYKGTPKLIINYPDAVKFWGNRFGQTSSLRWPISTPKEEIIGSLKEDGAAKSGLNVIDVKKMASQAASQGIDFGMLFASMSFFIITAALLLCGLLLAFQLENRREEMGLMLAAGFTAKDVRNRFMKEGLLLSVLALLPGIPLGLLYTDQVVKLLSTIWIDAVGTTDIYMHIDIKSLLAGALTFLFLALLTVWLVVRKFVSQSVVSLLNEESAELPHHKPSLKLFYLGVVLLLVGIVAVISGTDLMFAVASALLLLSVLCLTHGALQKLRHGNNSQSLSLSSLAIRNLSRRSSRSLGAFILMACGAYLVLNTAARQKGFNLDKSDRLSGTGGFEYFAKVSVPLRYKPDSAEGLDEYALEDDKIAALDIVSVRLHRGDDASCLNLNRAQNPQIYGFSPGDVKGRFNLGDDWNKLSEVQEDGAIPAIGDENTVLWGLGLYGGVGSIFETRDEMGRTVRLKIVALAKNSILQGALIVSRGHFDRLYPAESGYSLFMIDVPDENFDLQESFGREFADFGMEIEDSGERLRNFFKIEATYLVIFQMLGGLGLILGSCGFGFLILRNVQDRSGELAIMQSIGYKAKEIRLLLLREHVVLLLWSVLCGAVCAFISWIPLFRQGAELPISRILLILGLIVFCGIVSCVLSARTALKKDFLNILKNE